MFQVVQRRKDSKWECRVCKKKQSIIVQRTTATTLTQSQKVYAVSHKAADVRGIVQKYNMETGQRLEAASKRKLQQVEPEEWGNLSRWTDPLSEPTPKKSKWTQFIDETELRSKEEDDQVPFLSVITLPG